MCSQFAVLTQFPHNTFKDTVFQNDTLGTKFKPNTVHYV